jgi:hypothetical protein
MDEVVKDVEGPAIWAFKTTLKELNEQKYKNVAKESTAELIRRA